MKKNRKLTVSLLVVLIVALVLVGCNKSISKELDSDIEKYIHDTMVYEEENGARPVDACFISNGILGVEKNGDVTTVYLWQLGGCYIIDEEGKPVDDSGWSIPFKIEVKPEGDSYTIVNTEMPKDGSEYMTSIKEIFPASIVKDIENYYDSKLHEELTADFEKQVTEKYPDIGIIFE